MVKSIYWHEYRTKKKKKKDFVKDFFKLMNISDFGKTMESVRKHGETKLVTIEKIRNYFVIWTKLLDIKAFLKKSNNNRTEKKRKKNVEKTVYLGLLILEISKIIMFEFWYDYVKTKYNEKTRLCFMD